MSSSRKKIYFGKRAYEKLSGPTKTFYRTQIAKKVKSSNKKSKNGATFPSSYAPTTEIKSYDESTTTSSFTAASGTPGGISLFQPQLGSDILNRVGRKCSLLSLDVIIRIIPLNGSVLTANNIYRITIVYDSQPNGALPHYTDIYQDVNGTTDIDSPRNLNNRDRFKVLMSETASVYEGATGTNYTTDQCELNFNRHIPLNNMEAMFNSTNGGTVADLTTGSIILFFSSANTTGNIAVPTYRSRIRFMDI